MENFISEEKTVTKYVHEDGSETAIKHWGSCQQIVNPLNQEMETVLNDRNKYTIFISTTRGCFMECKFCHLTMKSCS